MLNLSIPVLGQDEIAEILKNSEPPAPLDSEERENEVKARYEKLAQKRMQYLWEARAISQAVIPYLYPPEGTSIIFDVESANQSLVAKGLMNLSKELSSTIFPSNARFFNNKIKTNLAKSQQEMEQQQEQSNTSGEVASVETAINNKLLERDKTIRDTIRSTPDAENVHQLFIHSQVAGEAVFFKPNVSTSKVYTLEDFVAVMDSTGETVEVVVRDSIHSSKFTPEQLRKLFGEDDLEKYEKESIEDIIVYTRQIRRYDKWEIQVEVAGKRFPEMEGFEELEAPPFIVVPFMLFPGRDYGVGWCSQNRGDIIQFENLSLAMNELCKAACKIVAIVPPEMKVNQQELSNNPGLSWVFGQPGEIQMILADVSKNIQAVQGFYTTSRQVIQALFLLNEAIQRNAERVTAEEIQKMSESLRNLLGGLYLSLARRFQYPYIRRMITLMEKEGLIPELPENTTQLVLTAGIATMEAQEDLQALDQLLNRVFTYAKMDPTLVQNLNKEELITRLCNLLGVVRGSLILTQDEAQSAQGVSQLMAMIKQLGPSGPSTVAQLISQMMMQQQGQSHPGAAHSQAPQGPPPAAQSSEAPQPPPGNGPMGMITQAMQQMAPATQAQQ